MIFIDKTSQRSPRTAKLAEKQAIVDCVQKGLLAEAAFIEARKDADRLRANGFQQGGEPLSGPELEFWQYQQKTADAQEKLMTRYLNCAVELAKAAYNIAPETTERGEWENATMGPMKGDPLHWDPKFYHDSYVVDEYTGSDGKKHYIGGAISNDSGGRTWANGRVDITLLTFRNSIPPKGHPGVLAASLHHEAAHFKELISEDGSDAAQAGEVTAYTKGIERASVFQLKKRDIDIFIMQRTAAQADIDQWADWSVLPSSKQEDTLRGEFYANMAIVNTINEQTATLENRAKRARVVRMSLALSKMADQGCARKVSAEELGALELLPPSEYAGFQGAGECGARLYQNMIEQLKAGQPLVASALNLKGERISAEIAAEVQKASLDRTNEIARMYEFKLEDIAYGLIAFGNARPDTASVSYVFKAKYQDDVVASLFLARTCIDQELAQPSELALKIIQKEAGSAEFIARITPSNNYDIGYARPCMDYLLSNPTWLTTASDIQALLNELKKQRREADKYRKKQEARNKVIEARNQEIEKKILRDRDRAEQRGGSGGNQHDVDLTPERETLRKYRGH